MKPEIENAIRVVAEFDGVDLSKVGETTHYCPECGEVDANHDYTHSTYRFVRKLATYLGDRDTLIEVAMKLPDAQKIAWIVEVKARTFRVGAQHLWNLYYMLTAPPETLLLTLSETINQMKGEK